MKRMRIFVLDLIHNGPSSSLYRRIMFPNHLSIMPQVIAVWCREEGHEVDYSIYTGTEKWKKLLPEHADLVIISSFTYTAQLAYALSNYFRSKGMVTVLGGPHARSYPEDACLYFDYVVGLIDKDLLKNLLHTIEPRRQNGIYLTNTFQPASIPGVCERWEFIEKLHRRYPVVKIVPMIGSFGCPYQCDFCVDSGIQYQILDQEQIKEDLRFLVRKMAKPRVSWYDPNFGIRFNSIMETIESAVPPGSIDFIAESSLSVLKEPNVKRLQRNGFKMIMPGIESWFSYGEKSGFGSTTGMDKVSLVADRLNMAQQYIPYVQSNFIFGIDCNEGENPFNLTKRFFDQAPGAYPSIALLNIFGENNEKNIRYEMEDRIIPFPFHMMMSVHTMNVIPKHYSWEEFYLRFIDMMNYGFSPAAMYKRFKANKMTVPRWITLLLSMTIGGTGKIRYLSRMIKELGKDRVFQSFVRKETTQVPAFIMEKVKKDLGPMWHWLPNKSLSYDQNMLSRKCERNNTII